MTDCEFKPLRYGETERHCIDCGKAFKPASRNQKYCMPWSWNHRGKAHYGGWRGYEAFRADKEEQKCRGNEKQRTA